MVSLCSIVAVSNHCNAQEPSGPAKAATEETGAQKAPTVQFSELDTFYLRNKSGELIPIFKFSFEDFERLLRSQSEDAPAANKIGSPYQITSAKFSGTIAQSKLQASVVFLLELQALEAGPVEIPLGLNNWALSGPIESGGVEYQMKRDDKQALRLTFQAEPEVKYQFRLPLVANVTTVSNTFQLRLPFQQLAPTTVLLAIDQTGLNVDSNSIVGMETREWNNATEISAKELSESSILVWRSQEDDSVRFRTKAQLTTTSTLESLSLNRWQASSTIRIRPFSQPVTELVFAAPRNATDFAVVQSGVRLAKISWEEANAKSSFISENLKERQFLLLSPVVPISEPVDYSLTYLVDVAQSETPNKPVEFTFEGLQGFDCVFLSGTLELLNSQRELDTTQVTATGIAPARNLSSTKEGRKYEISRQDYRLTLATRQRPAQISVAPTYVVTLGGGEDGTVAILRVNFKCSVQGQYNEVLAVPLKNWNLLDTNGWKIENDQILLNPADRTDLSSNIVEFSFIASKSVEEDDIDVELPIPLGSSSVVIEPAELNVIPAVDFREFRLDSKSSAFEIDNQSKLDGNTETSSAATFRSKSGTDVLRLKGKISLKPRVVDYSQSINVLAPSLRGLPTQQGQLRVRQSFRIEIQNQPISNLWFLCKTVSDKADLKVSGSELDTIRPESIAFRKTEVQIGQQKWIAVEPLLLDRQLQGEIFYEWEDYASAVDDTEKRDESLGNESKKYMVSILQPVQLPVYEFPAIESESALVEFLMQQTSTFNIKQRYLAAPENPEFSFETDANWVLDASKSEQSGDKRWVPFGNWPTIANVLLTPAAIDDTQPAIRHAELQTWWQNNQRLDRLILAVDGNKSGFEVSIPNTARVEQVLVDGKPKLDQAVQEDQLLRIEDSADKSSNNLLGIQIVEIWMSRPNSARLWSTTLPDLPQFANQHWCQDFRWMVIVDGDWQCLSWSPLFYQRPNKPAVARTQISVGETSENSSSRKIFENYLSRNTNQTTGNFVSLYANQLPDSHSILLVNRYWLRLASIVSSFVFVGMAWLSQAYRNFYFWMFTTFIFATIHAFSPQLFSDLLPMVTLSAIVAMIVLFVDSLSRSKPSIIAEMDTFVGSTRTLNQPSTDSNRSHASNSRGLSAGPGANELR